MNSQIIKFEATYNFIEVIMIRRGERNRINEILMKHHENIA